MMADLYRVTYISNSKKAHDGVNVSATSPANAVAAAKTNDPTFTQHVSVTLLLHNIIVGS
jgi:hypothetical protein